MDFEICYDYVTLEDLAAQGWPLTNESILDDGRHVMNFGSPPETAAAWGETQAEAIKNAARHLHEQGWITLADLSRPDDIRAKGWMVAVHNDYRLHGELHTFWLFTKDGRCVKGEGLTDRQALNQVRDQLERTPKPYENSGTTSVVDSVTKISQPVVPG